MAHPCPRLLLPLLLLPLLLLAAASASCDDYDTQTHFFGDLGHMDDIVAEMARLGLRPLPGAVKTELGGQEAGRGGQEAGLGGQEAGRGGQEKGDKASLEASKAAEKAEEASSSTWSLFSSPFSSDDNVKHNLVKRTAEEGDEDVSDILGAGSHRQGRLFYNFDRGSAFNTSVAFTIPLFSFSLPGSGDVTEGLDGTVFGTMAFVSLFLLGGLGVAIYTTTQGAIGSTAAGRALVSDVMEITPAVLDILAGISRSY